MGRILDAVVCAPSHNSIQTFGCRYVPVPLNQGGAMNLHGFFKKPFRAPCKSGDATTKDDLLKTEGALAHGLASWAKQILERIQAMENKLMATQKEIADGLTQLTAQIGKIAAEQAKRSDELLAKIVELEAVVNAGGNATTEVTDALAAAKTAAQALDDVIPDAPTPA